VGFSGFFKKECSVAAQKGGAVISRALYALIADTPQRPSGVSPIARGFADHGGLGGEALIGGIGSTVAAAMVLLV